MYDNQSGITEQNSEVSYLKYEIVRTGGGLVLPYMRYIGVCSPKGYDFFSCFGHK